MPVIEQYVLVLMDYTGVNTDGGPGVCKDSGTTGSFRGKLGEQVEECTVTTVGMCRYCLCHDVLV